MSDLYDAVVIGAGQAGLASGYYLKRAGLRFVILEASARSAGSWPLYYDSLKLFSPARYSGLPGMAFPGDPDRYPLRDEVIAYLEQYAATFALPVVLNTRVEQVTRNGETFQIHTTDGRTFRSKTVIAATGSFHRPNLPHLPGQEQFRGRLLHAREYRSPGEFKGQRVIVVGARNSAVQIAVELAQVSNTTLAAREAVKFLPQRILGQDIHFWMRLTRLDTLPLGHWFSIGQSRGVLDTGVYRAALSSGKPDQRPMFTGFTANGVVWSDGSTERVDAVIWATGYLPSATYLASLGVLDSDGRPVQRDGIATVPGLYVVGLSGQRSNASATLRGVGPDSHRVVSHLRKYVQS